MAPSTVPRNVSSMYDFCEAILKKLKILKRMYWLFAAFATQNVFVFVGQVSFQWFTQMAENVTNDGVLEAFWWFGVTFHPARFPLNTKWYADCM